MIIEATPLEVARYTAQYELLRSQVIGATGAAAPRGVGLALLLHEGMPGWLKGVESVIRASLARRTPDAAASPASEPPGTYGPAAASLRGVPHQDLTALLASLVLSTRCVERLKEGYPSCP